MVHFLFSTLSLYLSTLLLTTKCKKSGSFISLVSLPLPSSPYLLSFFSPVLYSSLAVCVEAEKMKPAKIEKSTVEGEEEEEE